MELKIRNDKDRKLGTIEKIFENHFETRIEKDKHMKIQTTRRIDRMPNVFLIKYERFNNSNWKKM